MGVLAIAVAIKSADDWPEQMRRKPRVLVAVPPYDAPQHARPLAEHVQVHLGIVAVHSARSVHIPAQTVLAVPPSADLFAIFSKEHFPRLQKRKLLVPPSSPRCKDVLLKLYRHYPLFHPEWVRRSILHILTLPSRSGRRQLT
eukprot:CAMPEP_0118987896 /NCGR_PEP_ID=MMETSP1173-20130426/45152_1 /TAXON_ID=1034831 /ORGANISM="Rhizochromulina marina cf, Strain CCMP1243" /LENGTH=142 /DNA_ID=CAMNT_0006938793 /DNA_START=345 /DNA_END=770 /DNA_ORIENTATION=+